MAHRQELAQPLARERLQMDPKGRILVPAALREKLGWKPGDKLLLDVTAEGDLLVRSFRQIAERLRGSLAHLGPAGVLVSEELIRERREEARREEEE